MRVQNHLLLALVAVFILILSSCLPSAMAAPVVERDWLPQPNAGITLPPIAPPLEPPASFGQQDTQDLTTYDEVDPGTDLTVIAAKITATATDTRNTATYVGEDFTAGYFDGNFGITFKVTSTAFTAAAYIWPFVMVDAEAMAEAKTHDTATDPYLAMYLIHDGADLSVYIRESDEAGDVVSDNDAITSVTDTWTYYFRVRRDWESQPSAPFGQLYCSVYSDAGMTTEVLTLKLALTEEIEGRLLYAYSSWDSSTAGKLWTGTIENYRIDGLHWDMYNANFPFYGDTNYSMDLFDQGGPWTILSTLGGGLATYSDSIYHEGNCSAHFTTDGGEDKYASATPTIPTTLDTICMSAWIYPVSIDAGSEAYLIASVDLNGAGADTILQMKCKNNGGTYEWYVGDITGVGAWDWGTANTRYQPALNTWHQIVMWSDYDTGGVANGGSAIDDLWVHCGIFLWNATLSTYQWHYLTGHEVTTADSTSYEIEQVRIGNYAGDVVEGSEFYIDDVKVSAGFPAQSFSTRNPDGTIVYGTTMGENHIGAYTRSDFFTSADEGVTFTYTMSQTGTEPYFDNSFWGPQEYVSDNDKYYAVSFRDLVGNQFHGMYLEYDTAMTTMTIVANSTFAGRLSSLIEDDPTDSHQMMKWAGFTYDTTDLDDEITNYAAFVDFDTSDYSESYGVIARSDMDIADYLPTEPTVWRRPSDNVLVSLIRFDHIDSANNYYVYLCRYYVCKDTPYAAGEGLTDVTGTADGNTANYLVDSGASFSSDGIQVGAVVRNMTDFTIGTVKTVANNTHIELNADTFPDGNEDYEICSWGEAQDPGDEWDSRGGGLSPTILGGELWVAGHTRESDPGQYMSWVARVEADPIEDDSLLMYTIYDTSSGEGCEAGNGHIASMQLEGQLYLDVTLRTGIATFMQLDSGLTFATVTTTDPPSEIKAREVVVAGDITSEGGSDVTKRGFVIGTATVADNPGNIAPASSAYACAVCLCDGAACDSSPCTETGSFGTGAYNSTTACTLIGTLDPDTTYYYRAWVYSSVGYVYGDEETFTTTSGLKPALGIGPDFVF